jgi:hypothetical protein
MWNFVATDHFHCPPKISRERKVRGHEEDIDGARAAATLAVSAVAIPAPAHAQRGVAAALLPD